MKEAIFTLLDGEGHIVRKFSTRKVISNYNKASAGQQDSIQMAEPRNRDKVATTA